MSAVQVEGSILDSDELICFRRRKLMTNEFDIHIQANFDRQHIQEAIIDRKLKVY